MDLIYMTSSMQDVGVLLKYELDLAFGQDENNFECQIQASSHCCQAGYYLYIEGTEYGGMVDSIENDTGAGLLTYSGRTWHGILGSKIIMPLTVSDASSGGVSVKTTDSGGSLIGKYLIISGDANNCIQWLINRLGLSALFQADSTAAGVNIQEYQFNRFTDAYSGLVNMLSSAGMKLNINFSGGHVVLSATQKYDYSQDEEFNSDQVDFVLKKKYKTVNHLVCLGSGELDQRTVIHLYADSVGNISQAQTFTGMNEVMDTFDYPSAENADELISKGKDRFRELIDSTEMTVECDESVDSYDIGDTVGAYDEVTQISISAAITKKIVTIKDGKTTIQYKVGD